MLCTEAGISVSKPYQNFTSFQYIICMQICKERGSSGIYNGEKIFQIRQLGLEGHSMESGPPFIIYKNIEN